MRCVCANYSAYHLFLRKRRDRVFKPPDSSMRTGCRIRTAETCAKTSRCAASVSISAAARLKAGLMTPAFSASKFEVLPCLLAFGKTLRVREMASDALQKLDGKGLPESERENACNRSPSRLALLLMSPQEQQSAAITINGDDSTGARGSQILPFKDPGGSFYPGSFR